MKVLEPGRAQIGWATEAECTGAGNGGGGCGAKLLVDQSDLYITSHTDYGGGTDHFVTFKCVSCGSETDLQNVPHSVRNQLPTKRQKFYPQDNGR